MMTTSDINNIDYFTRDIQTNIVYICIYGVHIMTETDKSAMYACYRSVCANRVGWRWVFSVEWWWYWWRWRACISEDQCVWFGACNQLHSAHLRPKLTRTKSSGAHCLRNHCWSACLPPSPFSSGKSGPTLAFKRSGCSRLSVPANDNDDATDSKALWKLFDWYHLRQYISLWTGPVQSVQNAADRLIFRIRRSEHITPALISLHWLCVPERISFRREWTKTAHRQNGPDQCPKRPVSTKTAQTTCTSVVFICEYI